VKAIVRDRYGPPDVLHLEEAEKPTPSEGQVLVRVSAASLNKSDWFELTAPFPARLLIGGLRKPKNRILGGDISGTVEAVGSGVTQLKPGDEVFGTGLAGLAEYVLAREVRLVKKPGNVGFDEAAAVPVAAVTALQGLRKGRIRSGQKVLVYGASGGVGTFAVQMAKAYGADVTAVTSPSGVANARALGADRVIDYTKEDFTKEGPKYDLIIGVNGFRSIFAIRRALKPNGTYMFLGASRIVIALLQSMLLGSLLSKMGSKKSKFMIAKITRDDLSVLKGLIESGKVRPLVDRSYPFEQAVEAFRYFGEGHTRGKVVITAPKGSAG
jgi:NADPH:quinone reductase-like Zn-dependent oxidoreductase